MVNLFPGIPPPPTHYSNFVGYRFLMAKDTSSMLGSIENILANVSAIPTQPRYTLQIQPLIPRPATIQPENSSASESTSGVLV
jgi:hypothetical protein